MWNVVVAVFVFYGFLHVSQDVYIPKFGAVSRILPLRMAPRCRNM